jgi:hypothetical protein
MSVVRAARPTAVAQDLKPGTRSCS